MKRASTISNIDCVMPQVNSRWRCSNRCEAAKRWVEYPDHIFVDRIDMHIEVVPVELEKIAGIQEADPSSVVRARVITARNIQTERFKDYPGIYCNAQMSPPLLKRFCPLDKQCLSLLKMAMQKFGLSARAYDRIIKLSRTIADLASSDHILPQHIAEAIQYRSLDRESWGS